jgi:hypothetical protein
MGGIPWHIIILAAAIALCWAGLKYTRPLGQRRRWIFLAIAILGFIGGAGPKGGYIWATVGIVFLAGTCFAWSSEPTPD